MPSSLRPLAKAYIFISYTKNVRAEDEEVAKALQGTDRVYFKNGSEGDALALRCVKAFILIADNILKNDLALERILQPIKA